MNKLLKIILFLSFVRIFASCGASQFVDSDDTLQSYTIKATYYSDKFVGRKTSSGEVFSQDKFTAAHKSLPLGTFVRVINPQNNASVIVKINDRCPKNGIIDLTKRAAKTIGIGCKEVTIQILPDSYKAQWEAQQKNNIKKDTKHSPKKENKKNEKKDTASKHINNTIKNAVFCPLYTQFSC